MIRCMCLAAIISTLGACATVPSPLQGKFSQLTPNQARQRVGMGEQVRWGGAIIAVNPLEEETCIKVLANQLDASARPIDEGYDQGRFIACREGFLDPARLKKYQDITVIGRVSGIETQPIGEFEYLYPVLDTEVVYIWPERDEVYRYTSHHHPFLYSPFYWPWPYYYGYWSYYPYR